MSQWRRPARLLSSLLLLLGLSSGILAQTQERQQLGPTTPSLRVW